MIRRATVAGYFYPARREELESEVRSLLGAKMDEAVLVAVCPHAGYVYSGMVAGAVYSRLRIPRYVVILCPNHTGMGKRTAIMSQGLWETPLGTIPVNQELAGRIKAGTDLVEEDAEAHLAEHSLEVQLPFLQVLRDDLELVPICLSHLSYPACEEIGLAVARAVRDFKERVLIIASTDMTHYEPHEVASKKDKRAIDKIIGLDPEGLYNTVRNERISMCGYIPTTTALAAAMELGASKAELVLYRTSGDASGDYDQVVGYAGIIVK